VNVGLMIKQRLQELRPEQKDLAAAAGVTDSYVSQLVARKKLPPFPKLVAELGGRRNGAVRSCSFVAPKV
jgi:transcriptional regulator with XRE-family HTH domain